MKKLKILMVAGSMHVGGIENQLMHFARNADQNRFQIDFTSTMQNAFYREEIEKLGGKFILIPAMNWRYPFVYDKAMYHVMKEGNYDVVHSHELFHSGITLFIAWLAGVPCRFVHAHNWCDDDGTGRKRGRIRTAYNIIMRALINVLSTTQIACSTWAGKFLYGERMLEKPSYHLLFNSVDTFQYLKHYGENERGEFCEEDDWINVIHVARISPVKNQLFLIEIAEEFKKRGKKIRILCAGDGEEEAVEAVRNRIKEKNLEHYMLLLGIRSDIDILMRKSRAFVLPSKYEGMPLVMIEAQASGLPCVVADTFSHEVDFELGNVEWLKLEAGAAIWADFIERSVMRERPEKSMVEDIISKKKFDARMFSKILCELYQQDYETRGKAHD